jgi:hypothetical protein
MVLEHTWAAHFLVPLFHVGNILAKAFPLLVTDGTKVLEQEVPSVSLKNLFVGSYFIPYFYKSSKGHSLLHHSFMPLDFPKRFL